MSAASAPLDRAVEELGAARARRAAGFRRPAVAGAPRPASQAARGALLAVGEAPPTAAAAVAAFTRRVVVRGGLDPEHGAVLRRLFDDRGEVERALAERRARGRRGDRRRPPPRRRGARLGRRAAPGGAPGRRDQRP